MPLRKSLKRSKKVSRKISKRLRTMKRNSIIFLCGKRVRRGGRHGGRGGAQLLLCRVRPHVVAE